MNIETTIPVWQRIEQAGGVPVEVTEEEYWEALEVLPPIYIKGVSWFAVSEACTHNGAGDPVYQCYAKIERRYFAVQDTLAGARKTFEQFTAPMLEGTVEEFETAVEQGRTISLFGLANALKEAKS